MQEFKINDLNILKLLINVGNTGHITNCYIIWSNNDEAVVIDPADKAKTIIQIIEERKLKLKAIFITHCHADHIGALSDLISTFDVPVFGHENDINNINDKEINCKEIVGIELQNIDTSLLTPVNHEEIIYLSDMWLEINHTPRSHKWERGNI